MKVYDVLEIISFNTFFVPGTHVSQSESEISSVYSVALCDVT